MQEHRNYTSSLTKGEVRFIKNTIIICEKQEKVKRMGGILLKFLKKLLRIAIYVGVIGAAWYFIRTGIKVF